MGFLWGSLLVLTALAALALRYGEPPMPQPTGEPARLLAGARALMALLLRQLLDCSWLRQAAQPRRLACTPLTRPAACPAPWSWPAVPEAEGRKEVSKRLFASLQHRVRAQLGRGLSMVRATSFRRGAEGEWGGQHALLQGPAAAGGEGAPQLAESVPLHATCRWRIIRRAL